MVTITLYAKQKKRHRCTEQTFSLFFLFKKMFIYLWLGWGFSATRACSSCGKLGLVSNCGTQASHCGAFSSCRMWA